MTEKKIVITGAGGFIGSCLVSYLNFNNYFDLVLVDVFDEISDLNLLNKQYVHKLSPRPFFDWMRENSNDISAIVHLGANTNTQELNHLVHRVSNELFTKKLMIYCNLYSIKIIFASSAATYGAKEGVLSDDHSEIENLIPLNPYAHSKHIIDKWILKQELKNVWIGLKFFNVYGPNEYHKNKMASMVLHAYHQITVGGKVKLFKSYNDDIKDGDQCRDFIYVVDIVKVIFWMLINDVPSGIYNLGTGESRTFSDLTHIIFNLLSKIPSIEYIDMPDALKQRYQYKTKANISKLRSIGYSDSFFNLEDGIKDYVSQYLTNNKFY